MARVYLESYPLSKMKKRPNKALEQPVIRLHAPAVGGLVPAKQRRCVAHK